MSRHGRVLVAMSGGVDSSVAAGLLHEGGYEVVGVTMKTWDYETSLGGSGASRKQSGCCSLDDMNDARAVAVALGASHTVVDIRDEFGGWVVDRFAGDYLAGRTPNPCVLCNTHIKWAALLKRADALGCEHIATGHYARVREAAPPEVPAPPSRVGRGGAGRFVVSRGLDRAKDQSYVLWGVAQDHLARTLLPLGGHAKPEIRRLAAEMGFDHVAGKKDSYEICFVPDDDYRGFLRRRHPALGDLAGGPLVHVETGEVLGAHDGYPFYTVGQRRGLGLALGEPAYVVRTEPATNTVVVGPRSALAARALTLDGVVWGKTPGLEGAGGEVEAWGQIRHRDPGAAAVLRQTGADTAEAVFAEPRAAVAPGQAAVFYDGDDVLAGGWIESVPAPPSAASRDGAFVALPTL
ncbi:tRNA 2-thiouridine(34) synthase MnmA [Rubrivirga sp. S365]|uniref:tRNA 2-thiouridine(34) synthase MnmA n=1 Tax=Rubrivirga sp. S365 TaxID=3076080 RepID=UPI0028C716FA|nr:tRNA 2-thiouridine(34) synthase MnmA [Rubrivirga sp. S365]MDT7855075.1 tRNA 2-thiouridine(34) synthase MnmA [Rubrivirga sp. S365]